MGGFSLYLDETLLWKESHFFILPNFFHPISSGRYTFLPLLYIFMTHLKKETFVSYATHLSKIRTNKLSYISLIDNDSDEHIVMH